ncbi:MAG: AlpA family phage regulatory protein [Acidobacteriota bacterium]
MIEQTQPRLLRTKDVLDRLNISRATLWRWERAGLVPARRRIGPNIVGWLAEEIDEFIESRPALGAPREPEASS